MGFPSKLNRRYRSYDAQSTSQYMDASGQLSRTPYLGNSGCLRSGETSWPLSSRGLHFKGLGTYVQHSKLRIAKIDRPCFEVYAGVNLCSPQPVISPLSPGYRRRPSSTLLVHQKRAEERQASTFQPSPLQAVKNHSLTTYTAARRVRDERNTCLLESVDRAKRTLVQLEHASVCSWYCTQVGH